METQRQRDLELVDESSCVLRQSKQMPTLFQSSEKRFNQMRKWEVGAVVTNDSVRTYSSILYIDYFFKISVTASYGTTSIIYKNYKIYILYIFIEYKFNKYYIKIIFYYYNYYKL